MDVINRIKKTVTNVLPGNPLARDFDIHAQVASSGPGLFWKIFSAVKRSTKEEASVFLFEKKLIERHHKKDREVIIESLRKGVQQLTKLRHPKILSVIQPLEETREALAFATEPVFGSLANVLGFHENIQKPSKSLVEFQLFEVEIKHGLLQVLEGLGFLHQDARMIHRNICPPSIVLSKSGTWKLSGFEFCQTSSDPQDPNGVFTCLEWRSDMPREAQPNLDFMAPEYEFMHICSPSSDMYSFGILLTSLYNKGKPLYECRGELSTFRKNAENLGSFRGSLASSIPSELLDHVKLLLNMEQAIRPDAAQMSKVPFFEDMACLALQYIDTLFQRENMEKSNFFKGLPKIIEKLPKRVSQQRILPALFKEGVNANMVPFILPSVFLVAEQSTEAEYRSLILPELIPYFKIKEPVQVMLMFLQNMSLLLSKTPTQQLQAHVFPLIFSALEADSPQIQELCLSIIPTFADQIEYATLKNSLVPRIKKLCLATSVLNVRVKSLICIGKLMDQMDKWFVLDEVLPFLREIPTREPAVLMSILGIHKIALTEAKLGITKDVMASKVLPFLIPLCIDSNLNLAQFNAYMTVVREMLSKVENEHRTKLEQLDQIQSEHKTIEMNQITSVDSESDLSKAAGGGTFMDRFLSGVGLSGAGLTSSPKHQGSPEAKSQSGVNGTSTPPPADVSMTSKKTHLSLEEKQRLAKQQEQEIALKSKKSLVAQASSSNSTHTSSSSKPAQTRSLSSSSSSSSHSSKSQTSVSPSGGPRDLTSTLMQSNMMSLSSSSSKPPMGGGASTSYSGINSMNTGMGSTMGSSSSAGVDWSGGSNRGSTNGMGSVNSGWNSSLSQPTQPMANRSNINMSSLDSLLPNATQKAPPMRSMMQPQPTIPPIQPPPGGMMANNSFNQMPVRPMMGGGMAQNGQPQWGNNTNMASPFQQPSSMGMGMQSNQMGGWGGGGGGGMMMPQQGMMGGAMGSNVNAAKPAGAQPLSRNDINDLLG